MTRAEIARCGGLGRARKYSHEQLSEWSRLGGRPRYSRPPVEVKTERGKCYSNKKNALLTKRELLGALKIMNGGSLSFAEVAPPGRCE